MEAEYKNYKGLVRYLERVNNGKYVLVITDENGIDIRFDNIGINDIKIKRKEEIEK